jgi:hypothetical protein
LRGLEYNIEESSSKLEYPERFEDLLFDDVGQEGSHNFVVDLISFREKVFAESKGLMCEHDKEEMELECVELFFGFDKMVPALVNKFLEVEFHFIVSDEFEVNRIEDGIFGVVVFAEFC